MQLLYCAPDEVTLLLEPTADQLAEILLRTDHKYWRQGGSGEATINVVRASGEPLPVGRAVRWPRGTKVEYASDQPSLWIKQPELGRFFLTWDFGEGWYCPYDGSKCEEYVMDERGGDPFKIPRACLVDPAEAVEIASHFVRTREKSPAVAWAAWDDLPLPEDWYDDSDDDDE